MTTHQKIIAARKKRGLTQEQLAESSKVTVRTIQRIESGDSIPRVHTLKAIAFALDMPLVELSEDEITEDGTNPVSNKNPDPKHTNNFYFLKLLNFSCFTYLFLPFVHVLIPLYLLSKNKAIGERMLIRSWRIVQTQIYWLVGTHLSLLLIVSYNIVAKTYLGNGYLLNYIYPVTGMYILNAFIIIVTANNIEKADFLVTQTESIT